MNDRFLQFLGLTKKAGKLAEGYNKCEETVKLRPAFLLILSEEVSENTREKFFRYCEDRNIPVIQGYSSEELGAVLGRPEVNVLCVTDEQMGKKLVGLYEAVKNNRG